MDSILRVSTEAGKVHISIRISESGRPIKYNETFGFVRSTSIP